MFDTLKEKTNTQGETLYNHGISVMEYQYHMSMMQSCQNDRKQPNFIQHMCVVPMDIL